ncbi:fumarylacetoacetate hydrolase family protein [Paenibacillus swuensis]|uniref:fumarylacetoacetate hydrolase family protein n=1 Tax=Paenibacillus swuensis TaxID=1178515 RepID=UPI000838BE32|nr:fumarylacetoacetate hydrolase family protein [Paenibacillus swuensis]
MNMETVKQQRGKIVGVGPNLKAFRKEKGITDDSKLTLFIKSPESLVTGENVYVPASLRSFLCEVEMAAIIGKTARNVSVNDALSYVAGYALANDMTADEHFDDGRFKFFDETTPVGTMVSGIDPMNVTLEMRVNGELIQRGNTSDMLFSVPWVIAHISSMMTLREGDIILTGTPAGPMACKPGDVIELSSPELGTYKHMLHISRRIRGDEPLYQDDSDYHSASRSSDYTSIH